MGTVIDLGAPETANGITIQQLDVRGYQERRVPGIVLTPADAAGPRPVLLWGHGFAAAGKRHPATLEAATFFVRHHGWVVAIIDAPFLGERLPAAVAHLADSPELRAATWSFELTADFAIGLTADWAAMVDALGELPACDTARIGYFGDSMGSIVGIPVVAAEPRICCAVFLVGGISGNPRNEGFWNAGSALERTAAAIGDRQVLLLNQSEDAAFSREMAFRLYDALAGPKRLMFFPGGHSEVPDEAYAQAGAFFQRYLASTNNLAPN
jgi:pimeloyl-ACP methyl ester carboxylesterase